MKRAQFILTILFFSLSITGCSVPLKDSIKIVNGVRNIQKISTPGVKEELITETKNILRDIQSGGTTQR
jgi:hypothetical protein